MSDHLKHYLLFEHFFGLVSVSTVQCLCYVHSDDEIHFDLAKTVSNPLVGTRNMISISDTG